MAELTFKSAGVSTREIDISQPRTVGPTGVPAGIIGTSQEGPAFIPLTFANYTDFITTFGESDGEKFGPMAVSQWLTNAQAVTYMRVLGVGDGKQRDANGNVTNAGFTVGNRIIQGNGLIADNTFATSGNGSREGRTYFLGSYMSESNGSTIFSDAGIQSATTNIGTVAATATITTVAEASIVDTKDFTLTDAAGVSTRYNLSTGLGTGASGGNTAAYTPGGTDSRGPAGTITIGLLGTTTAADVRDQIIARINAGTNIGFTATASGNNVLVTQNTLGTAGNTSIAEPDGDTGLTFPAAFSGGRNTSGAVPILRGVLLAPSGVILHLSGGSNASNTAPVKGQSAAADQFQLMGRHGGLTGSLNLGTQEFVMLMNGYTNTDADKSTVITASLDMTAPNYFANVFNTDPFKIEEEGHLLYGHYDIYPDLAAATGSGAVTSGVYSAGFGDNSAEDIVFLLTSSVGRGSANSSTQVDYESFTDRFTHAVSPFVISQTQGGKNRDLFRVHALSDGANVAGKYKFSIENIKKSSSIVSEYGTFDFVVRRFSDTDIEPVVLESFRGLSLDPSSDRYIGRIIGDQNIRYNFDVAQSAQKIVVEGNHPVRSRFVRVEMSDIVENASIEKNSLPFGFRGPNHLMTSGSFLANESNTGTYLTTTAVSAVNEPPIPYRDSVALGTGLLKRSDSRFFWGIQTTRKTSATQPNQTGLFDKSFSTFTKHFPNHKVNTLNFSVGNNPNAARIGGSIVSCDDFNNNKFVLENIRVRTGSDAKADPDQWLSASYVRNGAVGVNHTNKTRAFNIDDLDKVANTKFAKFTFLMQGGFDGVNIFDEEKTKLSNTAVYREVFNDEGSAGVANNTVSSYRKAVDLMSSKTDVDIQLLAIPGIRHTSVTDFAIQKVEDRFDALYIMDIEERDRNNSVITSSVQKPHVANTVQSFKDRALNTSFAASYFPDVVISDPNTNALVQVPPSVAVLGAYSFNDKVAHPWFAPAGYARGALNTVEMSSVKLNRTNLDDLYEVDINPISEFPGIGITIWGQKTLLASNSALDRINVRRLLVDVRRKVKNIANALLFEPNREETLERFNALVNPIMQRIQEQSGVDRFKVLIDTTTTTDADVENNTIRGKIFLQPTRSIEFVSLDFVVTNAGSNI